jgi:hypothetical protein
MLDTSHYFILLKTPNPVVQYLFGTYPNQEAQAAYPILGFRAQTLGIIY